jgi:hypothetical protein
MTTDGMRASKNTLKNEHTTTRPRKDQPNKTILILKRSDHSSKQIEHNHKTLRHGGPEATKYKLQSSKQKRKLPNNTHTRGIESY